MSNPSKMKMKRQLVASHNNLERSFAGMMFLHKLFVDVHPELAEGLEIAAQLVMQSQEILETFALKSWGMNKNQYKSYRAK